MGVVYKGLDPAIGRTIAIKSIRLTDLTDEAERQRLRDRLFREAQSAGMLSHPNIVTIYDIAEVGEMAYIFMEFVNGPSLAKLLASAQAPDPDTLLAILRPTAAALDYAHKKGIVHRDIKPANIMIGDNCTAKITDFGVAKIISQNKTVTGTLMGTPSYMPPEQIEGLATIDGRADQYSLAAVVYEALTGEKPFTAEYLTALLFKILRDDFLAPQRLNPTLGPRIEVVLRRAMAKSPTERYDNCAEFVGALSAACRTTPGWTLMTLGASQSLPTSGSLLIRPVREISHTAKRGRTVRNSILTSAAIAAICAGAYFEFRSPPPGLPQIHEPETPPARVHLSKPPFNPAPEGTRETIEAAPAAKATPITDTPRAVAPQPPGEFELTATPPGSIAIFDNNPDLRCVTPCTISLEAGRHTIAISNSGYREEH